MNADIKDRQPGGQEEAVDHSHQDHYLNDNGNSPQFCLSVSDIKIFLNRDRFCWPLRLSKPHISRASWLNPRACVG
jgi:hypothetical protein